MRVETSTITKHVLYDVDKLDPVTIIMEDFTANHGQLTISCWGKAWTAYWGAMGGTIHEFIKSCSVDYIVGKLSDVDYKVVDYEQISKLIGEDVDRDTLTFHHKLLVEHFGPEWFRDLPEKPNPDYVYLARIVTAVKEFAAV